MQDVLSYTIAMISTEDKINSLEYFTRIHFSSYQFVECGLLEYFAMLRRGDNTEFLDLLHSMDDLMAYSYTVRDTHQDIVNPGSCRYH